MPATDRRAFVSYTTLINQYGVLRSVGAFAVTVAMGMLLGRLVGGAIVPDAVAHAESTGGIAAVVGLLIAVQARAAGRSWGASAAWGVGVAVAGALVVSVT